MSLRLLLILGSTAFSLSTSAACASRPEAEKNASSSLPRSGDKRDTHAEEEKDADAARVAALANRLRPLHSPLGPEDLENGWLAFRDEPGQSFKQWLARDPEVPTGERNRFYILPIGDFTEEQKGLVTHARDFLEIYYDRDVEILDRSRIPDAPTDAFRKNERGDTQYRTTWLIDTLLAPNLPEDAVTLIGLTAYDLWPGDDWKGGGWNYLHGMASHRQKAGIWSFYRLQTDDPKQTLRRVLKTASHEVGHSLSMLHCTAYPCNMGGRISVEESDESPLALCPECLSKLLFATGTDARRRFQRLIEFTSMHGLTKEEERFSESLLLLGATRGDQR